MTHQTSYFVDSEDIIRAVVFDIGTGQFDCGPCRELAQANPGRSLWVTATDARYAQQNGIAMGVQAAGRPVAERPGTHGFICYTGDRAFAWNPETGASIETPTSAVETTQDEALEAIASGDATTAEIAQDELTANSAYVLPRSAADAIALARQLQGFARWLPGGELEGIAHDHAAQANLCGEYERIVCPTFGWTPRRGEENSMARYSSLFFEELDTFERDNAHLEPLQRLALWMERYEAGGFANRAVVEHAEGHLESHKRDSVADLLEETLGWEADDLRGPSEFEVTVRVERTRTITEHAYVTVTVEAGDEDSASDMALDMADADDYYVNWEHDDEDVDEHHREVYELSPA